ncbi:MAG TPA: helix-turn-helix domain-containing protein [Allosphingosinicella sp.]
MQPLPLDPYIVDVLMRDLAGHDRAPSAFLVYLWLWRQSAGEGRPRVAASLQTIATRTGLSKSAVQAAVAHLKRRRLVTAERRHPTDAPVYEVHMPWRRQASPSSAVSSAPPVK